MGRCDIPRARRHSTRPWVGVSGRVVDERGHPVGDCCISPSTKAWGVLLREIAVFTGPDGTWAVGLQGDATYRITAIDTSAALGDDRRASITVKVGSDDLVTPDIVLPAVTRTSADSHGG